MGDWTRRDGHGGAPLGKICRRQPEGDLRRATRGAGGAPTCEDGYGQGHGHGSAAGSVDVGIEIDGRHAMEEKNGLVGV
jgi:hypothetical protein